MQQLTDKNNDSYETSTNLYPAGLAAVHDALRSVNVIVIDVAVNTVTKHSSTLYSTNAGPEKHFEL